MLEVVQGLIMNDSSSLLLGMPFLAANDAEIWVRGGWIKLHDRWYKLKQTSGLFVNKASIVDVEDDHRQDPVRAKVEEVTNATNFDEASLKKLRDLLVQYSDLWKNDNIGQTSVVKHEINLVEQRVVCQKPRRYTEEQRKVMSDEVNSMLEQGVIRPSMSPFASPVVLVKKKTGDWRFCIDYRLLNKNTVKDAYPMPRIDDLLHSVKTSKYFVSLDLRAGYWQVQMRESDIPKTAFRTTNGLYEFTVMPFGLVTAPATFQRLMGTIFGDLHWEGVLVYLDDILIHSETVEGLLKLLKIVLDRLRASGLTLRLKKCSFGPSEIDYLGYVIGNGVIKPQMRKVEAIRGYPAARNLQELRRLLGLFGYYRCFIPQFSEKAEPITRLLKNNTEFQWGEEQDEALKYLRNSLSGSVLHNLLEEDSIIIETDASDVAIAAILSTLREGKEVPVEFASKTLSDIERNWPTREKEAYAIVWALRKFDEYIRGRKIEVRTDHKSLEWIMEAKKGKIARWAMTLHEFELHVIHRSGVTLAHVDALSRVETDFDLLEDRMVLRAMRCEIPSLSQLKESYKHLDPTTKPCKVVVKDGLWFFDDKLFMPEEWRLGILDYYHNSNSGGHCGVTKMNRKIRQLFAWPKMLDDTKLYVKGCLTCQRRKAGKERNQGYFVHHPLVPLFHVVHMDHWGPFYFRGEKRWLLTMIDRASRWVEVAVVKEKSARITARKFVSYWMCRYGIPKVIITDNDVSFKNDFLRELALVADCQLCTTVVYHPEGNSPIESFHRHIKKLLPVLMQREELELKEIVQLCMFSYRSSFHTSLQDTPGYMLFGTDVCLPREREIQQVLYDVNKERSRLFTTVRREVFEAMQQVAKSNVDKMNRKRKKEVFGLGDLILARVPGDPGKLDPKWSLPKRVIDVRGRGRSAQVQDLVTREISEVHIQNARFIREPQDENQLDLWLKSYLDEGFHQEASEELYSLLGEEMIRPLKRSRVDFQE